jgi:hypothetical protein
MESSMISFSDASELEHAIAESPTYKAQLKRRTENIIHSAEIVPIVTLLDDRLDDKRKIAMLETELDVYKQVVQGLIDRYAGVDKLQAENALLKQRLSKSNQLLLQINSELETNVERNINLFQELELERSKNREDYKSSLLQFKTDLEEIRTQHEIQSELVLELLEQNQFLIKESDILREYAQTCRSINLLRDYAQRKQ